MTKLIKIDYFPKYINKITSFHFIKDDEYNKIIEFINEKHFFIENFFRISKKLYEHVSKENIIIEEVIDSNEINIITNYLEFFSNDFDLLDLLQNNLNYEYDSGETLSDEDLIDTINVMRIFESNLSDNNQKIKDIVENNPHLLEDEIVTECYSYAKNF